MTPGRAEASQVLPTGRCWLENAQSGASGGDVASGGAGRASGGGGGAKPESGGGDGDALDLHEHPGIDQGADLHHRHEGAVVGEDLAVGAADLLGAGDVRDVDAALD